MHPGLPRDQIISDALETGIDTDENRKPEKVSRSRELAKVSNDIQVGDRVRLLGLPDWLVHDLPASEQAEMRGFIGQSCAVNEIDSHGYYWLGFGTTIVDTDGARYSGHSFCVPRDFIERDPLDQPPP